MNRILLQRAAAAAEKLRASRIRATTRALATSSSSIGVDDEEKKPDLDPLSLVKLTVNDRVVTVPRGITILEAARSCGVLIPTLCAHPRLRTETFASATRGQGTDDRDVGVDGGLCRVCLVDAGDPGRRLVPACATPVSSGMKVRTDTPEVDRNVRGVLSLLRSSGDHGDCATCEATGECELQSLLARYHVVGGSPVPRDSAFHEWDESRSGSDDEGEKVPTRERDRGPRRRSGVDSTNSAISIDLSKCVECGRCVSACNVLQEICAIGLVGRGASRHVAAFGDVALGDASSACVGCGQCSLACPTGAIEAVPHWRRVKAELEAKRKKMVVQVAPAVRVAIGETAGLGAGTVTTGQLVSALRLLGFDYVFDTNFAADVTVMEESAELLRRLRGENEGDGGGEGFPLFTSCCPAWVTMAERTYPHLLESLSTTKSPHIILGTVAKRTWAPSVGIDAADVFVTSVMPCTAKKAEAAREDLAIEVRGLGPDAPTSTTVVPAVDAVITTRELGRMIRDASIPLGSLDPEASFDSPLGDSSGAAALFGASGGVAEAALRSAYKALVGSEAPLGEGGGDNPLTPVRGLSGIKELALPLPEEARKLAGGRRELRVAVASGAGAARALVERITKEAEEGRIGDGGGPRLPRFDFVEVMACPGGCVGGGGQPRVRLTANGSPAKALAARARAIYAIDSGSKERRSHENAAVKELYEKYLGGGPGSEVAERELHRRYRK